MLDGRNYSAQFSVSSLRSLSVHLDPRSLVGLTTLLVAFPAVSVAPVLGTDAGLQDPEF